MKYFKPIHKFSLEVTGKFACFTDPICKVERTSYPAPTHGALEYLIERIYGHPCIRYRIDKLFILSPIKYYGMYVNERPSMGDVNMTTGQVIVPDAVGQSPMQRMVTYLRDVDYVINFTMYYDKDYYRRHGLPVHAGENAAKHIDQLSRRIAKGQCEYNPVLGLSECGADFCEAPKTYTACKDINESYYSLYKVVHLDDSTSATAWCNVDIKDGVLDFSKSVIQMGDKEFNQEEFLNIEWRR